jgi:hypothetical protein
MYALNYQRTILGAEYYTLVITNGRKQKVESKA